MPTPRKPTRKRKRETASPRARRTRARATRTEAPEKPPEHLEALLAAPFEAWPGILAPLGARPHHAGSLRRWLFQKAVLAPEAMTDLPLALRSALAEGRPPLLSTRELGRHEASDGSIKLLLGLADGECIETVSMPARGHGDATLCVSTQVGCAGRVPLLRERAARPAAQPVRRGDRGAVPARGTRCAPWDARWSWASARWG